MLLDLQSLMSGAKDLLNSLFEQNSIPILIKTNDGFFDPVYNGEIFIGSLTRIAQKLKSVSKKGILSGIHSQTFALV
jgi:hypothetical protein